MAKGQENLTPFNELTVEAHREIAKKGAEVSNKVRKDKKIITETLALLLNSKVVDPDIKAQLEERGITEHTELKAMCIGMVEQARKNPQAFREILDRIEGKVTDKIEHSGTLGVKIVDDIK